MKKLFVLFTALLVLVPSIASARLPHHNREYRGHDHHRNRDYGRRGSYDGMDALAGALAGAVVAATVVAVVDTVVERKRAAHTASIGQCMRDVPVGYYDGYGRFVQTGQQRIQAPCQ